MARSRPFQDHDVSPRMVKGRSMRRLAQRVASLVSCRPARWRAPMARFLLRVTPRGDTATSRCPLGSYSELQVQELAGLENMHIGIWCEVARGISNHACT